MKRIMISSLNFALTGVGAGQTFTLKSNDLSGQFTLNQYADRFGCNGNNISPQLYWQNPPADTVSFAVTIFDIDAPTGHGYWHWIVYNIPADIIELKSDSGNASNKKLPPEAIQVINDSGSSAYFGPCPPKGHLHLYIITVHALKTKLTIDPNDSPDTIGRFISKNSFAKASLAVYGQH